MYPYRKSVETKGFICEIVLIMSILNIYRWFLFLWSLLLLGTGVFAQTSRQSLEEQRKKALKEIDEIGGLLKQTTQSQKSTLEKLNLLNAQITQFDQLIGSINAEITYTERQIAETSANVSRMTSEIDKMKEEYSRLVFQAYKNRGQYNTIIYVLSAKDFNEAYRRMKYFQQYSEFRKKQVAEIIVKQEELRIEIELLAVQKNEKVKLLAAHRQESKRLDALKIEENKEVNQLKSKERQLKNQLAAEQRKVDRLNNEINKLITAEAKKQNATPANLYNVLTPEQRLISTNFKSNKGRLPWPTEKGAITSKFGLQPNPYLKNIKTNNLGINITTVGGSDVRVVFDGEVIKVGAIQGEPMFVLVKHGNFFTLYQNLVDVTVKTGDKVKLKDSIGKIYTEKGATTAVLQFQIYENDNRQNPELWIVKQ